MTILPPDFVAKWLAPHSLPGSIFFLLQETLAGDSRVSMILSAVKRDTGWAAPSYVALIFVKDRWEICPWICPEIYAVTNSYGPPADLFAKIDPSFLKEVSQIQSIDQIVKATGELLKKSEEAATLGNRLKSLNESHA